MVNEVAGRGYENFARRSKQSRRIGVVAVRDVQHNGFCSRAPTSSSQKCHVAVGLSAVAEPTANNRPHLCLVDHSYHKTTASNRFLLDLLGRGAELTVLHDQQWNGGPPVTARAINAVNADAVVFFQIRPQRALLARLRCRNLTWVPMRDDISTRLKRWQKLRPFGLKIISFSGEIEELAEAAGLACLRLRYYPPALKPIPSRGPAPIVLWWYRHADISLPLVESLIGEQTIAELIIRHAPDPGQPVLHLPKDAYRRWPIREVHGWLEPEKYRELVEPATHVIAPRLIEGIGLPVLEAMARGQCVIAANRPTMNEYITHEDTGLLYEPETPKQIELAAGASCGQRAHEQVTQGHARWQSESSDILPFILQRIERRNPLVAIHRLRNDIRD
ncbi:MAG: hypothetical protein CME32_01005 [Gimesia sp.]|nr:hypothetical protein [Gimesia sp.]